jgi:hypothetical protein
VIGLHVGTDTEILRGDCNQDTRVNLADAVTTLTYLFLSGEARCVDACDMDDTGSINVADAVYLLTHLFRNGPPPPEPYPACGTDRTEDDLDCAETACP